MNISYTLHHHPGCYSVGRVDVPISQQAIEKAFMDTIFAAKRVLSISAIFWNVHCPGLYVFMTSVMLFVPDRNTNYHSSWDKDARYFNQLFFFLISEQNQSHSIKGFAWSNQRTLWRCKEKSTNEIGVWRVAQEWGHHNTGC